MPQYPLRLIIPSPSSVKHGIASDSSVGAGHSCSRKGDNVRCQKIMDALRSEPQVTAQGIIVSVIRALVHAISAARTGASRYRRFITQFYNECLHGRQTFALWEN